MFNMIAELFRYQVEWWSIKEGENKDDSGGTSKCIMVEWMNEWNYESWLRDANHGASRKNEQVAVERSMDMLMP